MSSSDEKESEFLQKFGYYKENILDSSGLFNLNKSKIAANMEIVEEIDEEKELRLETGKLEIKY
jgi:hypothetical protein